MPGSYWLVAEVLNKSAAVQKVEMRVMHGQKAGQAVKMVLVSVSSMPGSLMTLICWCTAASVNEPQ